MTWQPSAPVVPGAATNNGTTRYVVEVEEIEVIPLLVFLRIVAEVSRALADVLEGVDAQRSLNTSVAQARAAAAQQRPLARRHTERDHSSVSC